MTLDRKEHIAELIKKANKVAIVTAPRGVDILASAMALAEYIDHEYNKKNDVIYATKNASQIQELPHDFPATKKILNDIEKRTLKVKINYAGTEIETIDYYKEDDETLILDIKPIDGKFKPEERIKYEVKGGKYDLYITLGIESLEELERNISITKEEAENTDIINIDLSKDNKRYGKVNVIYPEADSYVSLLLSKFGEWNYTPNKDVSQMLLFALTR